MSKDLQEQPKSEEVDIIQIFNLIGNAFKSFFNFLLSILEYIFKIIIILSLFIKRNLIVLVIAAVVGFIGGYISDSYKESFYTSTMIVEPSFNSNNQLIENIRLYGQLSKSKDSITLSRMLGVTPSEASKIDGIIIKPVDNRNELLRDYNEFVKNADTTLVNTINFEDYLGNLSASSYKLYAITVHSKERGIFTKIQDKLTAISLSNYTKKLQEVELNNLDKQIEDIGASLKKIEELRTDYKQLMLQEASGSSEAKPSTSANSFYFGSEKIRPTNELELFKIEESYRSKIDKINVSKAKKTNVINVVSGFQELGTRVKETHKTWYVLGALAITILFLLLKQFNAYLIQYEKKRTSKK